MIVKNEKIGVSLLVRSLIRTTVIRAKYCKGSNQIRGGRAGSQRPTMLTAIRITTELYMVAGLGMRRSCAKTNKNAKQ